MTSFAINDGTLFKVLQPDGQCFHGGTGQWSLPQGGEPGDWMPAVAGPLVPCRNGYHLLRPQYLLSWLGPALFVAEYDGEIMEEEDKIVVRRARLLAPVPSWTERMLGLFACDCAEHVLPFYEARYASDDRLRQTFAVARDYLRGTATRDALARAAAAALAAARAASSPYANARAALAYASANAINAAHAADAALAAAHAADAAFAAAHAADAALAAARAASANAINAARAASANAINAADGAALAYASAYADERSWQVRRLRSYIRGEGGEESS